MIDNELILTLSSGLFYLSKSMGNTPNDYVFGASKHVLDGTDLIASYTEASNINQIYEKPDYDTERLENLRECTSGFKDLLKFLEDVFKPRIGNADEIIEFLTDDIDFMNDLQIPDVFYICDFKRHYMCGDDEEQFFQSGNILFLPIADEFLVLHFIACGENFNFKTLLHPEPPQN